MPPTPSLELGASPGRAQELELGWGADRDERAPREEVEPTATGLEIAALHVRFYYDLTILQGN